MGYMENLASDQIDGSIHLMNEIGDELFELPKGDLAIITLEPNIFINNRGFCPDIIKKMAYDIYKLKYLK